MEKSKNQKLLLTLEYPPDIGGIANYYQQIVQSNNNLQVLHFKTKCRPLSWFKFFYPCWREIKKQKIINLQIGQVLPLGYLGLFFKFFSKTKYLIYVHGLDVFQQSLSVWKKIWIKLILKQANQIITNSQFVKRNVAKKYQLNSNRIKIIYPKIDLEALESKTKNQKPIKKSKLDKIILTVGRLVKRKGFDITIKALAKLQEQTTEYNFKYWIIGTGPDHHRLKRLVKKYNLKNQVKFLGEIATPEIYRYYQACDIFIMPCREINGDVEGFGIVFLEAAAFKKPIIAGNSGGAREAVINNKTGLVVNPKSIKEITKALYRLTVDLRLANKLGKNAYQRLKSKFTLKLNNVE